MVSSKQLVHAERPQHRAIAGFSLAHKSSIWTLPDQKHWLSLQSILKTIASELRKCLCTRGLSLGMSRMSTWQVHHHTSLSHVIFFLFHLESSFLFLSLPSNYTFGHCTNDPRATTQIFRWAGRLLLWRYLRPWIWVSIGLSRFQLKASQFTLRGSCSTFFTTFAFFFRGAKMSAPATQVAYDCFVDGMFGFGPSANYIILHPGYPWLFMVIPYFRCISGPWCP